MLVISIADQHFTNYMFEEGRHERQKINKIIKKRDDQFQVIIFIKLRNLFLFRIMIITSIRLWKKEENQIRETSLLIRPMRNTWNGEETQTPVVSGHFDHLLNQSINLIR